MGLVGALVLELLKRRRTSPARVLTFEPEEPGWRDLEDRTARPAPTTSAESVYRGSARRAPSRRG